MIQVSSVPYHSKESPSFSSRLCEPFRQAFVLSQDACAQFLGEQSFDPCQKSVKDVLLYRLLDVADTKICWPAALTTSSQNDGTYCPDMLLATFAASHFCEQKSLANLPRQTSCYSTIPAWCPLSIADASRAIQCLSREAEMSSGVRFRHLTSGTSRQPQGTKRIQCQRSVDRTYSAAAAVSTCKTELLVRRLFHTFRKQICVVSFYNSHSKKESVYRANSDILHASRTIDAALKREQLHLASSLVPYVGQYCI